MKSNISLLRHGVSLLLVVLGVAMSLTINTCAANSDGSITKTAAACDVGHVESTELKHGGSWAFTKTYSYSHTCWKCNWSGTITYNGYKCVGTVTKYYANGDTYTDTCGALGWDAQVCPNCGIQWSAASTGEHVYQIRSIAHPCSHGKTSSHYYDIAYGYDGSSSTFKVWPITVVTANNINYTVSVSGCTAVDAAMSGKSVTVKPSGVTAGTLLKLTNNGVINTMDASSAYTFTMPSKPVIIALDLAKLPQSLTITTPVSKTYNAPRFNLNVLVGQ